MQCYLYHALPNSVFLEIREKKLPTVTNQLKLFYNHTPIYVTESHKYLGTFISPSLNLNLNLIKLANRCLQN